MMTSGEQFLTALRYNGAEKVVMAIDLGATTSGAVSYVHLYPGSIPAMKVVTRWPGQETTPGDPKLPSLVCYQGGHLVASGAEALEASADNSKLEYAQWFKLHLHPKSMIAPIIGGPNAGTQFEIPQLPHGVTLKTVYVDFLKYLFNHARNCFIEKTINGTKIWDRLSSTQVHIVLTIPNGWDVSQQAFLREAVIEAGLLPQEMVEDKLEFVTEGEASVHYALQYSDTSSWLKPGVKFAVCDAGGSTVDSTLYQCKSIEPELILEEVKASECVQAGSIFVNRAAEAMIRDKLWGSEYSEDLYIKDMVEEFERKTKRKFDGSPAVSIIKFGKDRDNDEKHGICKGRLSLEAADVEQAFKACVPNILASCRRLIGSEANHLILVGGFGESLYLRNHLKDRFRRVGTEVVLLEEPTKKAAAEGAAIWYTKRLVRARASRSNLGIILRKLYDPSSAVHRARQHLKFVHVDGIERIDGFYDVCVHKDQVITEGMNKTFDYTRMYESLTAAQLAKVTVEIVAYDGEGMVDYGWDENGYLVKNIRRVCTLDADMSGMVGAVLPKQGSNGKKYWQIDHTLVIFFGGTSMKAKVSWKEGSQTREGPVCIIPDAVY